MKTILPVANGIALIIMIVINYLSNTGIFNDNTMETISDKYFNYFTPAGYAFSIWGLIYLGLSGFVIYTGRSLVTKQETDPIVFKIGWWFVISCIANSLWIVVWLNDQPGLAVLVMLLLLVSLLTIIVNLRMELDHHPIQRYLFVFWPFAIYAGWVSVALIANVAAWLTKIDWNGLGISDVNWTIIMVCIAGLVNILMIQTRNLREYGLVGIWAVIAIAVSNRENEGTSAIIYTCYAVAILLGIFILVNFLKNRRHSIESS